MIDKPFAAATERNSQPILEVLRFELRDCKTVLEIGSGTGQHAIAFASVLAQLRWQTSDLIDNHAGINAWIDDAKPANVVPPLALDVLTDELSGEGFDAVYSANTAHIMPIEAVERMFALVAKVLCTGGVFCLYGPFKQHGSFGAHSNESFDQSLKQRDPGMGIRDLEELDRYAATGQMQRQRLYAMPANNCIAVWSRSRTGPER